MKTIIKWTIWQRRWSTVWWSVGVSMFVFINMIFYPSFKNQAEELQKGFENLPDVAVQLFGGSTDFFSPVGFLNSQIFFLMLPLLLSILAISLGSSLLAKEEQDKTIDLLLSRPISRSRLLASKMLSGIIILGIATTTGLITIIITARIVELEVGPARIAIATLLCFLLALSLGAISYALTASGRSRTISLSVTSVIALGGYLVSSLAGTVSWLATPAKLFPFNYYQPESLLLGSFSWMNLSILASSIVLLGAVSVYAFKRRDIY